MRSINNDISTWKNNVNNRMVFGNYIQDAVKKGNFRCIFHDDTHPSLSIDPEIGMFFCHTCGIGGDAIKFVEMAERCTFHEAVEKICRICGIESPMKEERLYSKKHEALSKVQSFFRASLSKPAKAYVAKRGISNDWAARIGIGYCPVDAELLGELKASTGIDFSMMGGRITFPCRDKYGMLDSFIGRGVKEACVPKYVKIGKSPDLYGIWMANITSGPVFLCEGPMDHAILTQYNYRALALLGTNGISQERFAPIATMSKRCYICLDSDPAGLKATKLSIPALYSIGVMPYIIELPPKQDCDEIIIRDKKEFDALVDKSSSAARWIAKNNNAVTALEVFCSAISSCRSEEIFHIEASEFASATGIPINVVSQSAQFSKDKYTEWLLSNAKLFPDLVKKIEKEDLPEWVLAIFHSAPIPEHGLLAPSKMEVSIGLQRLFQSIMDARGK